MINLNLGCDRFKLPNFVNIDFNGEVSPDVCIDLKDIKNYFQDNSVDFIIANHVLEHLEDPQKLIQDCYEILKPFRSLLTVIPDYTKCFDLPVDLAERVIIAGGAHKSLFNQKKLNLMLSYAGFRCFTEIIDLNRVPYLLVANVNDPRPDPWQTAMIALKT